MATTDGTAINFGFASTANGATITNLTGLLQSAELEATGDVAEVRDGDGDLVSETHYNAGLQATISVIVKGTSAADAITNSALGSNKLKGKFCPITACASMPELVDTSSTGKWRIQSSKVVKGNTDAARFDLVLLRHDGIVSEAT
jgi:hypothetical protein